MVKLSLYDEIPIGDFWFSTRPSAGTVSNKYRAVYHQLVNVMLKLSHYDGITIGDTYG